MYNCCLPSCLVVSRPFRIKLFYTCIRTKRITGEKLHFSFEILISHFVVFILKVLSASNDKKPYIISRTFTLIRLAINPVFFVMRLPLQCYLYTNSCPQYNSPPD